MADETTATAAHNEHKNEAGEKLHPYELLDSGMTFGSTLKRFGDKVWLTADRGAELEPYGSVRPWGTDDHDLVDDERDLPGILASAGGREDLARKRIAKRSSGKDEKPEESPARRDFNPTTSNRMGADPIFAAAPTEERRPSGRSQEKSGGRRS